MTKDHDRLWAISPNDEIAFRRMFERYYADLCIYAKRYVQDLNTREDLVQDVFCSLWIHRKKIDYSVAVCNYLITSVKNHCLNYLRNAGKAEFMDGVEIEKIPVYAEENEHLYLLHELEDLYHRTLDGLPEEYRIAFEMSRMENKSTAEIAEALGVSVRTVERYCNKVLEILKTELKDYLSLFIILSSV